MKIAIIGHPGSGKTYLAKRLSKKTGIDLVDIDSLFDKHPVYFVSRRLYRKKFKEMFFDKTNWIIDGYHGKRMPDWIWKVSDTIIFLDLPKNQLKKNVLTRHKNAKERNDFSHWQSTKANNIKNFGQINLLDKSLRSNFKRITKIAKDSEFVILQSTNQVDEFLDDF